MTRRPSDPGPAHTRLGCVPYLNALPLLEGLQRTAGVSITLAAPSLLLPMLESGEVDAALLSIIDSQRSSESVALLPCGVIGCDGRTLTVRVYSRVPLERASVVHADSESHTAAALVRVVLKRLYGACASVVPYDAREAASRGAWPETTLVIGDKVVSAAPPEGLFPHTLDLGEAWRRLTGMGFTYAAWACLARDAETDRVRRAVALLDRTRRRNAGRIDRIATANARERSWPEPLAREYLGSLLRYDAGPPGSPRRMSIERFFDWCAEDGILTRRSPTLWTDHAPARIAASPCLA